jgi:hypothetical protein
MSRYIFIEIRELRPGSLEMLTRHLLGYRPRTLSHKLRSSFAVGAVFETTGEIIAYTLYLTFWGRYMLINRVGIAIMFASEPNIADRITLESRPHARRTGPL